MVVRTVTTPMNPRDGATLAEQVLTGLRSTDGAAPDSKGNGHDRQSNGNGGGEPA